MPILNRLHACIRDLLDRVRDERLPSQREVARLRRACEEHGVYGLPE